MVSTIKAFYNPTKDGDTFKGLFPSDPRWDGQCADAIITDLQAFLKAAGRDYYVAKTPTGDYSPVGGVNEAGEVVPGWVELENQFNLRRSSDHRVVSLKTVTESYAPLSLMDIAEEIAPWVQAGWATPDAVFEAKEGSLEVLVLRLDAQGEITDDDFYVHYIVIQNPHATGGKCRGKIISFRIVCCNTFAAAVSIKSDFEISHRVAKGSPERQAEIMAERTREAIEAWEKVQEHIKELSRRVNVWKDAPITFSDAEHLTDSLLDITDLEKTSTRTKNEREAILSAFSMPQVGTYGRDAYDWVNAVTFVLSSPLAKSVQKSKVSTIERAVRNMDPNGTGFKKERKAETVLAKFLG
jgi:hypothetical protein